MKKRVLLLLVLLLLLSACTKPSPAGNAEVSEDKRNGRGMRSSSTVDYKPWDLEDYCRHFDWIFEATTLDQDAPPHRKSAVYVEVQVDRVFQGDLEEGDTLVLCVPESGLFYDGEQRLVIANPDRAIYEDTAYPLVSAVIYPVGDGINRTHILHLEDLSYADVIEKIETYTQAKQ